MSNRFAARGPGAPTPIPECRTFNFRPMIRRSRPVRVDMNARNVAADCYVVDKPSTIASI
jgi:hypothetical protein